MIASSNINEGNQTPSPKTPPDHNVPGHVNLSFEPYMFQASPVLPFYYSPYSEAWDKHYEDESIYSKAKYPVAICCFFLVIAIFAITYLILDAKIYYPIRNSKQQI
uniref:Ovule protein n=1 Tax=Parastrongyloides trichosuri TaxID=131310 RepID=A0A0N4ZX45_PARTI